MADRARVRVVFHGAITLFVGLLCGFPTVLEVTGEQLRLWRSAHVGLIIGGVWLLATAAVLPSLDLKSRELSALVWSLLVTAYGFMTALVIEALTGARAFQPSGPPATLVAFVGNSLGVMGALMAAALTISGAGAALRRYRVEPHTDARGGQNGRTEEAVAYAEQGRTGP